MTKANKVLSWQHRIGFLRLPEAKLGLMLQFYSGNAPLLMICQFSSRQAGDRIHKQIDHSSAEVIIVTAATELRAKLTYTLSAKVSQVYGKLHLGLQFRESAAYDHALEHHSIVPMHSNTFILVRP